MKIIASDYDGTLNYGGIDDVKRAAIARWRKAENLFGLISGRNIENLMEIVKQDRLECDFLVASNGAVVAQPNGNILKEFRCEGKFAPVLIERLFELNCPLCYVHTASPFTVKADPQECQPEEFTVETLMPIPYFNQISTFLPSVEDAAAITEIIRDQFGDILTPLQNHTCIDIVPKGVNKAQGIYSLLSVLGASHGDVIAVGDNINDYDMIAEFRSYAMNNAVESIKSAANHLTPGITELIERELC